MFEYFEDKWFFYIIFENLSSGNLYDYLKKKILNEEEIIEIFYNLLEVISYLHTRKIIHKLLNPSNILIHENKIKISNFSGAIINNFDDDFEWILQ